MNAATVLKNFFNTGAKPTKNVEYRYADLCAAMAEVDTAILRTAKTDSDNAEDAEYAAMYLPALWKLLNESFEKNGKSTSLRQALVAFPTQYKMVLRTAERILNGTANTYTKERRAKIREMINDLPELLKELMLSRELTQYVLLLVREVEIALDEYEVTGDFKLDGAFTRLQTSLNVIITTPKPAELQSKFKDFMAKKLIPCITAAEVAMTFAASSVTVLDYLDIDVPPISSTNVYILEARSDTNISATVEETDGEIPHEGIETETHQNVSNQDSTQNVSAEQEGQQ